MKKFFKITGIVLLSLIGLLVILFLLTRYVFQEQARAYLSDLQHDERVELLRTSGGYAAEPEADYQFTYIQDSVRAQEIRTYFRLDTLVDPAATTWENTLAVAKFVARNIPHANQKVYPEQSNAIALWEYHLNVEPAFNCRLHSILLHELLLSSGIVNRFVTCLPQDSTDMDCHVVNIVWLPERQKWAMIDSDMQAFVTDPAGTPLSLEEMRARYMAGEAIDIHPLLGEERNTDYYRAYWAKNLYWFACWEQAGYNIETHKEGRYVYLVPGDFEGFKLRNDAVMTTDDTHFWAAPQTNTI